MALGIVVSAWAGRRREDFYRANATASWSVSYAPALFLAIACGVLSPMLNYAFAFSEQIRSAALQCGASPATAGYAVWPIVLTAGFLPNLAYSLHLLRKNRTSRLFKRGYSDAALASGMGVLWMGSLACYGMSAARLGDLGTSVGWGIVQAIALITATLLGGMTQEWVGMGRITGRLQLSGIALLIIATFLMASGAAPRR
jgi:L-rhamnose-H+ transport protein